MHWKTPRGRLLLMLIALFAAWVVMQTWRARQAERRRAQQAHELELMRNGALEFMKSVGSPSKAMEQTGDPFMPRPTPHPTEISPEKRP
jgi:hypothetical protein